MQFRTLADLLRRGDGTIRTRDEAVREFGPKSVRVVEMTEALLARAEEPFPLSVPPRVFVSYRWGTAPDNFWVQEFVEDLSSNGMIVTYDRAQPLRHHEVPAFVANIAAVHFFVPVLDERYVRSAGEGNELAASETIDATWVLDELTAAAMTSHGTHGYLRELGLLRQGTQLPRGYHLISSRHPGNTIDVRTEFARAKIHKALLPAAARPPIALAARAEELLDQARRHLDRRKLDEAREYALEARALIPELPDSYLRLGAIELAARRWRSLWDVAQAGLRVNDAFADFYLWAALSAVESDDFRSAARLLVPLLASGALSSRPHAVIADMFDRVGLPFSCASHYRCALRYDPNSGYLLTNLGSTLIAAGRLHEARRYLERALSVEPVSATAKILLIGALIEIGDLAEASHHLADLRDHANDPHIRHLNRCFEQRRETARAQPVWPRQPSEAAESILKCFNCSGEVPISRENRGLCSECGAEQTQVGPCVFCNSATIALTGQTHGVPCPYCRAGLLERDVPMAIAAARTAAAVLEQEQLIRSVQARSSGGDPFSFWEVVQPYSRTVIRENAG